MTSEDQPIEIDGMRLEIHPAPTHDESAAIVAAVRSMMRRATASGVSVASNWCLAARREALHRELDVGQDGWRIGARLEP